MSPIKKLRKLFSRRMGGAANPATNRNPNDMPMLLSDHLSALRASGECRLEEDERDVTGLRLPNVYCIGAPKTATSFMYSVIRQHPAVCTSPKDDGSLHKLLLNYRHRRGGLGQVFRKFTDAMGVDYRGQPVFAHFNVGMMRLPASPAELRAVFPKNARFIISLRDPVKRAISDYKMRVRQYISKDQIINQFHPQDRYWETEPFLSALEKSAARKKKEGLVYAGWYAYIEGSRYAMNLEPYFEAFPRENFHVVVMEDQIKEDAEHTLHDLFAFMGLDDEDARRLAFECQGRHAQASASPEEIGIKFITPDGREMTDGDPLADIMALGVARIEIGSDNMQQLDLVIDDPSEQIIRDTYTLRQRHDANLTREEEKQVYQTYFADDVEKLERMIGRKLSVWYDRYC